VPILAQFGHPIVLFLCRPTPKLETARPTCTYQTVVIVSQFALSAFAFVAVGLRGLLIATARTQPVLSQFLFRACRLTQQAMLAQRNNALWDVHGNWTRKRSGEVVDLIPYIF